MSEHGDVEKEPQAHKSTTRSTRRPKAKAQGKVGGRGASSSFYPALQNGRHCVLRGDLLVVQLSESVGEGFLGDDAGGLWKKDLRRPRHERALQIPSLCSENLAPTCAFFA